MTRLSEDSGESITGGRATAGRVGSGPRQALLHHLPRRHHVGRRIEDQHDRRKPEHGLRANRVEAGNAVERCLERHGHQRLDVVGRQTRALRSALPPAAARTPGTRRAAWSAASSRRRRRAAPPARRRRCGSAARAQPASASVSGSEFGAEQLGGTGGHDLGALGDDRGRSPRDRRRDARSAPVGARRRFLRGPRTPRRRRGCRRARPPQGRRGPAPCSSSGTSTMTRSPGRSVRPVAGSS